ncbi:uncharacterized protein LOC100680220 [Nasonia vitripennis]|uniref:MADF domain-containing protein n=1 Tax=Nasonia vitripennis TaxID=7425 RepID=A0A7M7HD03_NASVI|nr:uncharacterized protein LOC100680220 [Nasonia vitripennis]
METHKFLGEFIDLYKSYPCLWKYSCKDYRNKTVKDSAYAALLDKLREIDPRADKNSVMRKINALRTSFRREHKKVRRVQLQTKKKYVPSLWYYELLKFVVEKQDFTEPPPGLAILNWSAEQNATSASVDAHSDDLKSDSAMDFFEDTESIDLESNIQIKLEPSTSSASSPTLLLTDEIPEQEVDTIVREEAAAATRTVTDRARSPLRQESSSALSATGERAADLDRFGSYVASKLKRSSRKQSIIAEKVIAEVLMRANLGTLDETTALTDTNLPPAPSSCLP